ncbi:CDP-alcohol phosphatidyltransferase family protein [Limibaculum sp. FT325]|uniref:CDP-alcohol phosphatidyltransferase family protein n=1 Tax=Thermohalobaculum sediminis TaxID=2939436 RepID=UPI0020BF53B1|nr:CDP-alcohol phosphatidyltransferase family protein [Limibaculum sediminis]MCL5775970.1 CDP-alcohol phosphatidyltransferase family protein [Limibaculum sediminis]
MAEGIAAFLGPDGQAAFGLSGRERLARQAPRAGLRPGASTDAGVVLRADHVYGGSVLSALAAAAPGTVLTDAEGRAVGARIDGASRGWALPLVEGHGAATDLPEGAVALTGVGLAGRYDQKLRKRADPLVMPASDRVAVERALFGASYKGVTDLVTKHVWPRPALAVTRFCALKGITPNQVTWASLALVILTFWLFWIGQFGPGLVAAWAMTFLDTVDGKLARVTVASSKLGDVLDHGIDLIHPPFWWWAWAVGCAAVGTPVEDFALVMGVIVGGYVAQRLEEGWFIARYGIEMHIWRPFDSLFREITARRNPNLLILMGFALAGAPREGLIAVAWWTAICFAVHLVRVAQAEIARRKGPLASWMTAA